MTSYESAVERLYALGHELQHGPSRKFELAHIRTLCQALGEPQRRFASVLIAGTNGKGSTAATLASILQASGNRVGLYTSPHLLRINERIRVQGEAIADAAFAACYERVTGKAGELVAASALPHLPSFFETVTAMAFDYFAASGVEIAVLEVGMGGRLDATNIVEPIVSVITDIDLDHQKFLGDTIAEIAGEKAGILRPNVAAVTLPQHPEASRVLGERMAALGARAVSAERNLVRETGCVTDNAETMETRFRLRVLGEEVEIVSPLVGRHQLRNLALAITAAEELSARGFGVTAESVARGTRETRWPCRFQRLAASAGRPEMIVDVAHNPAGARALLSALDERIGMGKHRMVLLFGAMADKAVDEIARILWPAMAHVVLTRTANNPRAATTADLAALAHTLGVEHSRAASVREGLELATARARALGPDAVVVIAGSIYVAGEAVQALQ